jgi:hypothetical protein
MVANAFLAKDKPHFVIGVGRWLCDWVELMVVLPKVLLRPFTLGIDKTPPKSFYWICVQW